MGKEALLTSTSDPKEMVAVDFIEFDEIRRVAKEWIYNFRESHPKAKKQFGRGVWENSSFYIGRTTTSVAIHRIAIPYLAVQTLASYLQRIFPEYRVSHDTMFQGLRVYLR